MLVSQSGMSGPRLAVERILRELADAAQRADELRCLDREEDGLAVRAGRELADRLDIFLRDEIVDRLRVAAGDGVGHHLRRLGLGLRLPLAGLGVAAGGLAATLALPYLALFLALRPPDPRHPAPSIRTHPRWKN